MFYLASDGYYRVRAWDRFPWLIHGFGTRTASRNGSLTTLRQVHSAVCIAAGGRRGCLGQGDALLENTPGRLVAVKTADCVPVLLVDERQRAVAAVHAGWRGAAQRIAEGAVAAMGDIFGSRPEDLSAAIGPAIGNCCYEVGPEVAQHFGREGRVRLDLAALNRQQLLEAGVPAGTVYTAGLCTACRGDEFHSYRRDRGHAGRMYSLIGIHPL